jgi:hypothetical protein
VTGKYRMPLCNGARRRAGARLPFGAGTVAVVLACAAMVAPATAQDPAADPQDLVLRLSDLPRGYSVGDDSGCGMTLSDESAPPELVQIQAQHPQRNCGIEFERRWVPTAGPAGPRHVENVAMVFESTLGAEAAFGVAQSLAAYVLGLERESLHQVVPLRTVGDAAAVYETDDALVNGLGGRPGVIAVWRTARVVSIVFVAGTASQDVLLRLAELQQRRITAPTQLRPPENDDREVALENPRLGIPVYWLGRRFDPPGALPALRLQDSFGPVGRHDGPGWRADIDYRGGVHLGLWRPHAWDRFTRTRLGRLVLRQPCGRTRRLRVAGGRGAIVAGHSTQRDRCSGRPHDLFVAHVHLRGVVVSVNLPLCLMCFERGRAADPYNSLRGMRAVVRGLHCRASHT